MKRLYEFLNGLSFSLYLDEIISDDGVKFWRVDVVTPNQEVSIPHDSLFEAKSHYLSEVKKRMGEF